MEEAKADELYRLFQRTDQGAKFKQGLGFAGVEAFSEPKRKKQAEPEGSDFIK